MAKCPYIPDRVRFLVARGSWTGRLVCPGISAGEKTLLSTARNSKAPLVFKDSFEHLVAASPLVVRGLLVHA